MDTDVLILVLATVVAGLWAAVLFARQWQSSSYMMVVIIVYDGRNHRA